MTESEVVNAMKLNGRGSNKTLVALVIVGLVLALVGTFTEHKALGFGGAVGGLIGYFSVLFLLIPFNAKKQFRQNRALRAEITMLLLEQGINFKSESGESNLQWSDIHKWKYGKGIYLLYITSNMFHMVPSRALSNEAEFSKLLGEYIGPRKA
ncbi:YcxB family protein [Shewanella avicenniae]|uniref:YcxB family protein n=1 Tax=Shewanella avicenniae TaxID=2814294 RepID=A0ABX7QNL3_9GAMM|nr:YcxB family protein [Shewanella avicenniae]QSX32473.1 YcxB family protein [Shewanella avicenniae]